jgi:hypothetical protein
MKIPVCLLFVFLLSGTLSAQAQSNSLIIRLGTMQPLRDLLDSNASKNSLRLNVGYGKSFSAHAGVDITAFADLMEYNFYFDGEDKRFEGNTLYTGIALTPRYCVNPDGDMQVSFALSIKGGYNVGYGDVKKYSYERNDYTTKLESKSVGAGYTFAFSPMLTFNCPTDFGGIGFELGYDNSSYGVGIGKLRSNYYQPIKYNSGYLFFGIFVRLHD